MQRSQKAIWASYWFAMALSLICLISYLVGYAWIGSQTVWVIPFLAFFPQAFLMAVLSQKTSQDRIDSLEERIRSLETQQSLV